MRAAGIFVHSHCKNKLQASGGRGGAGGCCGGGEEGAVRIRVQSYGKQAEVDLLSLDTVARLRSVRSFFHAGHRIVRGL